MINNNNNNNNNNEGFIFSVIGLQKIIIVHWDSIMIKD